jgi:hypothetical protein
MPKMRVKVLSIPIWQIKFQDDLSRCI